MENCLQTELEQVPSFETSRKLSCFFFKYHMTSALLVLQRVWWMPEIDGWMSRPSPVLFPQGVSQQAEPYQTPSASSLASGAGHTTVP